jgi:hypothetical protein
VLDTTHARADGYGRARRQLRGLAPDLGLRVVSSPDGVEIATGIAQFAIRAGGAFPLSGVPSATQRRSTATRRVFLLNTRDIGIAVSSPA